jgi:predicted DNA binding CopG/RHH family protein
VQDIGEKGGKFMKKRKVKYTEERIGKIKIVDDFLPRPKDLVLKEETTKITIALTKSSVDFFKSEAEKYHTNYQTMIRALIDKYTSHYI